MAAAVHAGSASRNLAGAANGLPVSDPPRRSYDAPGVLAHHQALFEEGGRREGTLAAYLATCLRDPFTEPRGRPARGANAARTQRPVDDSNLHPRSPRAPQGST